VEHALRDGEGVLADEEDAEDARQAGDHHARVRVHQVELPEHQEERQHGHLGRDHERGEQQAKDALAPGEAELREGVARHRVHDQRDQGDRGGEPGAVEKGARQVEAREERAIVLERGGARQEPRGNGSGLAGGHQRRRDHPQEGDEDQDGARDERRVQQDDLGPTPHAPASSAPRRPTGAVATSRSPSLSPRSRSCKAVHARMMAKSTKAIAAPWPMFHQRKPSSYMSSTTLSVLSAGPPWVMTYGSAKSWK